MKIKTVYKFYWIAFLTILFQNMLIACSCGPYEPVFCRAANESHKIIRGTVIGQPELHLMTVEIIENINNEITDDTIVVLGQDGFNCGASFGQFSLNDTLILALGQWPISADSTSWYLCGCKLHFLKYSGGMVTGQITDNSTSQPLQEFKDNILQCIDLEVSAEEISSDEFKIYPNPVFDILEIQLENPIEGNIKIFNSSGQLILQNRKTTTHFNSIRE